MWKGFSTGFWIPDTWLLNGIEKLCHKFQRLTGRTNFWLEGKVSALVAICLICSAMADFAKYDALWIRVIGFPLRFQGTSSKGLWFCWGLILTGRLATAFRGWQLRELQGFIRLLRGLANPEKVSSRARVFRYLYIIVWPTNPFPFSLWFGLTLLAAYLEACDPLPPCQGKVQEWVHKMNLKLVPIKADI